ncbi:MAG: alpha-galactosidase [Bacteroidales bacterium]|nr:alpha-galactosidase [Bacteroidales bacterium]
MKRLFLYLSLAVALSACADRQEYVRPPLMGWNSWNAYMVDISDSIIMNAADMMIAKGLKDAGYDHVNIDDGYFGYRDSLGYMVPHPVRFPKGMKHVPEYIHSLGMKAGIYSDAGHNTCGSNYNKDPHGLGAGLWQHEVQDAERYFNDWDFDFIKIDWCGGSKLGLDVEQRYMRIREIIDSVANKHIDINVCRWRYPGTWVSKVGSSWRVSGDIRPNWPSICAMIEKNLYLSAYAGGGSYNDMDMMVVGYNGGKDSAFWEDSYGSNFGLTYAEEEAHFTMWCALSSPLLIGCDLTYIPQETIDIITNPELVAVNQDGLGLQSHIIQHDGAGYVFVKDVEKRFTGPRALTLYNPSDSAVTFSVPAELMGFAGEVAVRDLNQRKDLGTCEVLEMTMPAHSAKLFKVEGTRQDVSVYEGEWAYVEDFTRVRQKEITKYEEYPGASCGVAATSVGGRPSGNLQWRDVYMKKGGRYAVSVICAAEPGTEIVLSVNGQEHRSAVVSEGLDAVNFMAEFKKGNNVVTVGNPSVMIQVVDAIVLTPAE